VTSEKVGFSQPYLSGNTGLFLGKKKKSPVGPPDSGVTVTQVPTPTENLLSITAHPDRLL
jgi:hypothetical protein